MLKTFQWLPIAIGIKSNSCPWDSRAHDLALTDLSDFIFLLLSHCLLCFSHTGLLSLEIKGSLLFHSAWITLSLGLPMDLSSYVTSSEGPSLNIVIK